MITHHITRRAVIAWVLYDVANLIFSMGVISLYFSLFVAREVGAERADRVYGLITATSMALIFFLSPLLGAMTDRARRRMPFLMWSAIVCAGATLLFARGPFVVSAALFVVANAAYQAGVQFYDSLLPDVSTEENRGRISGIGVGLGYIGSYIAVGTGLLVGTANFARLFSLLAIGFFLLGLPCFFFVRERGNPRPGRVFDVSMIVKSVRATWSAVRSSERYPGLLRFLIGKIFYTDAINTVVSYMSLYVVNVGVASGLTRQKSETTAQLVMLSAITVAIAGGIVWGRMVDRLGPKRTLAIVLRLWMVQFSLAAAIGFFGLPIFWLYVVAILGGLGLGGVWSSDRPYMLRIAPPDRVGEFYGLYGMVGRFSAVSGPILWSLTTFLVVERGGFSPLTGQSVAIVTLLAMIVVSYAILRHVSDEPRDWEALRRVSVLLPAAHDTSH